MKIFAFVGLLLAACSSPAHTAFTPDPTPIYTQLQAESDAKKFADSMFHEVVTPVCSPMEGSSSKFDCAYAHGEKGKEQIEVLRCTSKGCKVPEMVPNVSMEQHRQNGYQDGHLNDYLLYYALYSSGRTHTDYHHYYNTTTPVHRESLRVGNYSSVPSVWSTAPKPSTLPTRTVVTPKAAAPAKSTSFWGSSSSSSSKPATAAPSTPSRSTSFWGSSSSKPSTTTTKPSYSGYKSPASKPSGSRYTGYKSSGSRK